jgi:hypothetical protein
MAISVASVAIFNPVLLAHGTRGHITATVDYSCYRRRNLYLNSCEGLGGDQIWRSISVTTNLGYENTFYRISLILKNKGTLMRSPWPVSLSPLFASDCLNHFLWNLVCVSYHLSKISAAYLINLSNQSLCLYVYAPLVARQRLGKKLLRKRIHTQQ